MKSRDHGKPGAFEAELTMVVFHLLRRGNTGIVEKPQSAGNPVARMGAVVVRQPQVEAPVALALRDLDDKAVLARLQFGGGGVGVGRGMAEGEDLLYYEVLFQQEPEKTIIVKLKALCGPGDHGEPVGTGA